MVELVGLAVLALQGCLLALLVVAARRGAIAAVINAVVVLALSLLPALVELALPAVLDRSLSLDPALSVWIALAGVLHTLGMLGLYETTWWWDHLTHTLSAALVAALLYAALTVSMAGMDRHSAIVLAITVGATFAVGVFWELFELVAREFGERFAIDPVLVHYGWRDTAADLGFDVVGALLVVWLDLRLFVPVLEQVPGLTRTALAASGVVVAGGSVSMALGLWLARAGRG